MILLSGLFISNCIDMGDEAALMKNAAIDSTRTHTITCIRSYIHGNGFVAKKSVPENLLHLGV
ncbi:MAG TPA: hypothetical protein DCR17_05740 [Verrucomicrobiales bacterium]|nr:hypothetical protein [Pedosphaera sp.]HAO66172.1 hypothetical protein [Verrucomicrobiales bacterium]HAR00341.1 hypothetical protein [Verrucomicrobiales bacterium]HAW01867.1 hypothetical protein [Verrucomicrobiales bacterium]HBP55901.1 hypothetical protein [Verrucomicrobiales bacterium]|tara:strand:+ start:1164 stop:1352 length:189 start_codon:yes stop_codon:yes gene_type:complete